jgi:peptidoglycan/xylan/chitin deacetylase (PgdA/CDA1 family)
VRENRRKHFEAQRVRIGAEPSVTTSKVELRRWGGAALGIAFTGAVSGAVASGCSAPNDTTNAPHPVISAATAIGTTTAASTPPRDLRSQLNGQAFPDGVIALTFDDGPDAHTLELAEYLSREKISATFFVVDAWIDDLSADPGKGDDVFASGALSFPVLGDMVALGHRVANHTENHVSLWGASSDVVRAQLLDEQRTIDPYIQNELQLFRVPGGAWNADSATSVATDPDLAQLVGPVRWDIDRKDWEGSLTCHSQHPALECEAAAPGGALRVKPRVIASRYLESIEAARHGIILMHTRVGHVGSRYANDIAEDLIPQLKSRGFVFAAPVIHFSAPRLRFPAAPEDTAVFDPENATAIALGDLDEDGRADLCASEGAHVVCAISEAHASENGPPLTMFGHARVAPIDARGGLYLADVNGDHRADLCTRTAHGISCALASVDGDFSNATSWSADFADATTLRFGDLDGDGKSDVCAARDGAIWCARSNGHGFEHARAWMRGPAETWLATFAIGDIDGNGTADICGRSQTGISCALSSGATFGAAREWSQAGDFVMSDRTPLMLGDLNGDGRADICEKTDTRMICAFSSAISFLRATSWSETASASSLPVERILSDVNGDGRADLCNATSDGIVCEVAP